MAHYILKNYNVHVLTMCTRCTIVFWITWRTFLALCFWHKVLPPPSMLSSICLSISRCVKSWLTCVHPVLVVVWISLVPKVSGSTYNVNSWEYSMYKCNTSSCTYWQSSRLFPFKLCIQWVSFIFSLSPAVNIDCSHRDHVQRSMLKKRKSLTKGAGGWLSVWTPRQTLRDSDFFKFLLAYICQKETNVFQVSLRYLNGDSVRCWGALPVEALPIDQQHTSYCSTAYWVHFLERIYIKVPQNTTIQKP